MPPSRSRALFAALVCLAAVVPVAPSLAAFGDTPPAVSKMKIAPASFRAVAKGGPVTTKGGAKVSFTLSDGGRMTVSYRRATASGYKSVPGTFTFIGSFGENEVHISGRILKAALKPGRYRVVVKPEADGARAAYAAFRVLK